MNNGKRKLSTLLIACFMCVGFACADTYKNNVVDVRVNNENGNAVKVIIYTDRPYTDPVVVNKKANNKYVILMPETNSSLKSSPVVTNGTGTISNVSVNTQSVSGGKGYTKITITSEKAINVVPRTQQIVSKTKPAPATKTTTLSTTKPVTVPKTATQKPATQNAVANKQAEAQKLAQQKAKQEQAKKAAQQKANQQKVAQSKPVQQKPVQQAVKPTTPAPAKPQNVQPAKQPIEVLEQEIKTGQYANVTQDKNDEVLNQEIKENLENKPVKKKTVVADESKNKSAIEMIKLILKNHQDWSIWKILLLLGAVTFPILVIFAILGMDKKINKKIDLSFKHDEEQTEEYIPNDIPPVVSQDSEVEQATDDSFDNVLNAVDNQNISTSEDIDNLDEPIDIQQEEYNNDYEVEDFEPDITNIAEEEPVIDAPVVKEPEAEPEPYDPDGYLSDFSGINDKDFFDELAMQTMAANNADGLPAQSPADEVFNFMQEDSKESEEASLTQDTDTKEDAVQDENGLTMLTEAKLSETTGMYLVNYDNFSSLVGHIKDDYFVIKKFDELVTGKIFFKEAEKIQGAKRYLVRIGKNKMVVEVSPTSMTKLIDL